MSLRNNLRIVFGSKSENFKNIEAQPKLARQNVIEIFFSTNNSYSGNRKYRIQIQTGSFEYHPNISYFPFCFQITKPY